jgi:hypothetical protein
MNIRVAVHTVLTDPHADTRQIVILKSRQKKALLPIWIGASEANTIRLAMENIRVPRPLTHDLLKELLTCFNVQLEKAVIHNVQRNTYFASLYLKRILLRPDSPQIFSGDGMESFDQEQEAGDGHSDRKGVALASFQMDARPSDAIILSLRYGAPLYVNREILNQQNVDTEFSEWLTHIRPKDAENG